MLKSRIAPRVAPGSSPSAGTGHTSRLTGNTQYAANFSHPPRGAYQSGNRKLPPDGQQSITTQPRQTPQVSPELSSVPDKLRNYLYKRKKCKDARRSVQMKTCVRKGCAACRNWLWQGRGAQEVHDCGKTKLEQAPCLLEGSTPPGGTPTVRGPRSPADRGAALKRPILLEASCKSHSLGDFGPRTRPVATGPGLAGPQRSTWGGGVVQPIHTAHFTAPDERQKNYTRRYMQQGP